VGDVRSRSATIRRVARWALGVALVPALACAVADALVARDAAPTPLAVRDVAIVPGGNVYRGRPAPLLARRLEGALDLYTRGLVHRILVSGDEGAGEASAMRQWLVARGVPEGDVLGDPTGRRTLETMRNAATTFGVRSAFVATQPLYLDRSVFLAREAGIDAAGFSVPTGRLPASAPLYEAAKRVLAVAEVFVLDRLARDEQPRVVLAQALR
jgi:vancomycin permeability regulator SanA